MTLRKRHGAMICALLCVLLGWSSSAFAESGSAQETANSPNGPLRITIDYKVERALGDVTENYGITFGLPDTLMVNGQSVQVASLPPEVVRDIRLNSDFRVVLRAEHRDLGRDLSCPKTLTNAKFGTLEGPNQPSKMTVAGSPGWQNLFENCSPETAQRLVDEGFTYKFERLENFSIRTSGIEAHLASLASNQNNQNTQDNSNTSQGDGSGQGNGSTSTTSTTNYSDTTSYGDTGGGGGGGGSGSTTSESTGSAGAGGALLSSGGALFAGGGASAAAANRGPTISEIAEQQLRDAATGRDQAWVPIVTGGAIGLGGILITLGVTQLVNSRIKTHQPSDYKQATSFGPGRFFFGPDSAAGIWSRLEVQSRTGYVGAQYNGAYIDATPDRGLGIAQKLNCIYSGVVVHKGVFRGSIGYVGTSLNMFEGYEEQLQARAGEEIIYSTSHTLQGLQGSFGVQFFQGLFSPYAEAQFIKLQPIYPVGTLPEDDIDQNAFNRGAFYLPMSWNLVVGNTFNFAGFASSKGPLRSSFFLDANIALLNFTGPISADLQLTGGWGISWF